MVKQRMTAADVAAEAACLRTTLHGLRVANIYDINPKTYVLKLSKSGGEGEKILLVLESGVRFHTSQVMRDKSDIPSNFTLKLRKHLRTRRLEQVRQLGMDRAVDFVFGNGEHAHHLILEMYSQGNLILTDHKYEVLTLLRSHRDDDKGLAIMSRHPYPIHVLRLAEAVQLTQVTNAVDQADANMNLKGVVAGIMPYGPALAEHCVLSAGLDPGSKVLALKGATDAIKNLYASIKEMEEWFGLLETQVPQGYIVKSVLGAKKGKRSKDKAEAAPAAAEGVGEAVDEASMMYTEYIPLQLLQYKDQPMSTFPTFDAAMDEFYSKIEVQRVAAAKLEAERAAVSKLDKIRQDQGQRAEALLREAEEEDMKAQLIEYNLDAVDAAISAVNEALATGMDWKDLERMIKEERKAGNPIAGLIHSLQLEQNKITLVLSNYLDGGEDDDEANTRPATKVVVDLSLSAHSNAAAHFESRKKHSAKQAKTLAANEQALKAAEKKAQAQLQKARLVASVQVVRKPMWFERFYWFITSENYLVLSGRDAQQNELLVKRYFKKGDVYVHADLHGASSTIVKNNSPDQPIPPLSMQQAGCACVCRSKAWDNKVVTSAYWVHHHQVSKTAPTGEYLTTGSFMVRGKKNYLPPQPLVFGLGFMFKLDDDSIARHLGERAVRGLGDDQSSAPAGEDEQDVEGDGEEQASGDDDDALSTQPSSIPEEEESQMSSHTPVAMSTQASSSALDDFLDASLDVMSSTRNFDRYGLSMPSAPTAEEEASTSQQDTEKKSNQPSKRHMSAAEKKFSKQDGKQPAAARPPPVPRPPPTAIVKQQPAEQIERGAGKRGKTGKQKKVKEKYAEQDEEERELALMVLASEGTKKSRSERRAARKEKKEANRKSAAPLPATASLDEMARQEAIERATGRQWVKEDEQRGAAADLDDGEDEEEDRIEAAAAEGVKRGAAAEVNHSPIVDVDDDAAGGEENTRVTVSNGDSTRVEGSAVQQVVPDEAASDAPVANEGASVPPPDEAAEVSALLAEENMAELGDEERERLTVLDSLTGVPQSDDTVLFAVPVCGPYMCMTNWKYKVKLIPGTLRKGKAAKQAVDLLTRTGEVVQRERDLIKAVPDTEVINTLVGTVKMSMPGMTKLKQNDRKNKKGKS